MAKITAPVKGFTGEVVGVVFDKGTAETNSPAALAYFRRHGYTVSGGRGKGKTGKADAKPEGKAESKGEGDTGKTSDASGQEPDAEAGK